jgi:hypothetical protein
MKYYAGIGSRETPRDVQDVMRSIAFKLSKLSYCLRSGGADGADTAFERGAKHKQIFLPWDDFNFRKSDGISYIVPPFVPEYVEKFHPAPSKLGPGAKLLMSRNTYQVLGPELNDPVSFVLCWTKDGKASGGTGQAIRIAESLNIPVFNFKNGYDDFSKFMVMDLIAS